MTRPTEFLWRDARDRASGDGRNWRARIEFSMRRRVSGAMPSNPAVRRETVETETLAWRATSYMLARLDGFRDAATASVSFRRFLIANGSRDPISLNSQNST
jgi:hypothetical protein